MPQTPSNIDAYELYLEAWQLFVERRSLPRAIGLFEQAVAIDPSFARAWAGLAAIYNVAPGWGYFDRDYRTLAREAAETAIQLNPELSLPYAVLAMDWVSTGRSISSNRLPCSMRRWPGTPRTPRRTCGARSYYLDLGYFDRAERDARQCLEIDPAYEICRSFLALAALFGGDTERALEIHETALRHGFSATPTRSSTFMWPRVRSVQPLSRWPPTTQAAGSTTRPFMNTGP